MSKKSKKAKRSEETKPKAIEKVDTSQAESAICKASPVWPCFNAQYPDGLLPYA